MSAIAPSRRFPIFAQKYVELWDAYIARGVDRTLDPTDKENDFSTEWLRQHYFDVGYDALRIMVQALLCAGRDVPQRILDFPCGSARVTRHLRAMFPAAEIGACDLYKGHVDFCSERFGAVPIMSKENLDDLEVGQWDVIFCGSLLSHLPRPLFWPTVRFMARSLTPDGIAIITLEGRHALHVQDHKWKFLEDNLFDIARNQYAAEGFGFVDYNVDFRTSLFGQQENYGIALTSPAWLMKGLQEMDDIRILSFAEREWDDHQDVVVFGKPAVNAP
jgi:SAM-dependent methyltransferase